MGACRSQVNSHADRRAVALAGEQWAIATVSDLRACGVGEGSIRTRIERGWLHRIHRGGYSVGNSDPPWEARMLAAVKACGPGAFLSHVPGAMVVEILEDAVEVTPEVTVPAGRTYVVPGVRVHRAT